MTHSEYKLEYFVSEKNDYLVVSLLGTLAKNTMVTLEKVQMEISKSSARQVVLNLHDLTRVEVGGIPGIVRLQKLIRDRPNSHLRLCFLRPDIYKSLAEAGAVRPAEMADNLLEALKDLAALAGGAPAAQDSDVRKAA